MRTNATCEPEAALAGSVLGSTASADEIGFLRGLIQGVRCGVLAVDRDSRLLLLNDPARRILGLAQTPPRGTPIESALAGFPQLVRVLRESFSMESLPNRAELDLERAPAERRTIGFTISMIGDSDGIPEGAAIFFKDLTRIEHGEERERLRDRLAALGQMAASMAHEIRNPLAAIEVSCSLLRRRLGADERGIDLLDKVVAEVGRLSRTVDSSLEYVRPVNLSLGLAELPPLLDEAIAVAEERLGRKAALRVERRFAETMPPFLMDRTLLRQVFVNLVLNALEAVEGQGWVRVSTEIVEAPRETSVPYRPGERDSLDPWQDFEHFAQVQIADSGPGLPDEARGRLFYPFFTTKPLGSGVGLSTAKKIVDSHSGVIDVAQSEGAGAVFTVRLPMVLDPMEVSTV